MNLSSASQSFLHEADDLLARIEETALEIGRTDDVGEAVNQLFRAFHTIKGSGSMFGFDAVAAFTHHVETLLDRVREGAVSVSPALIEILLRAKDHIRSMLDAAQNGTAVAGEAGGAIIAAVQALLPKTDAAPAPVAAAAAPRAGVSNPPEAPEEKFHIRFRPARNLMVSGTNPGALLDEVRALGECAVTADTSRVPSLDQLAADECWLAWDIVLTTRRGLNAIRDVFIFVEDGSELTIEPLATDAPVASPVHEAVAAQPARAAARPVEAAPAALPPPAGQGGGATAAKAAARDAGVRVPSERLDRLVNLVGELVMNQSRLNQVAARANLADLSATSEELERLVAEMRDTVLGIRMMPIGTTFNRFKRLVHDLALELGKEIELVTDGAETELDKTVLDQLGDPLVHLIRNSIDHGIEAPDAREAAGKPRRGTVRLGAEHTGSNVVITIEDDGRGIDTAAVRAKAVERKLIAPDAELSENEIFDLVFLPGFSTAKVVTNVSGRGVGMDVVKRQIGMLRGTIHLSSVAGMNTKILLTLPLTLAIIDGLLVEVGDDQFIVPMLAVEENVELEGVERDRKNGRNVVAVRGTLVPYIDLRDTFAIEGGRPAIEKVVIVRTGSDKVGLVVDRVLGSHQTVIQSLGRFYRDVEVLSGATIMGDGRVALILDVAGLVRSAEHDVGESDSRSGGSPSRAPSSARGDQ